MNYQQYIKPDVPDFSQQIEKLESHLPNYTDHLNNLRSQIDQVHRLIQFFTDSNGERSNDLINFQDLEHQLRFNSFITICSLDLIVICRNILQAKHFWEEVYNLRQGYLVIYEALNSYSSFSEKIKNQITTYYQSNSNLFDELTKKIRAFRKEYDFKSIERIRNKLSGHIDSDFVSYFDEISSFDREKAKNAVIAFFDLLVKMQNLSKEIAISTNKHTLKTTNTLDVSINYYLANINAYFKKLEADMTEL